ncbi:hypothetical protein [Agromyces sp. ZXT2-6]|uniref:hypothetical protein n=1 Tax=Agromyces sp. ZXT2-6 TaxID=3461153 RepID=UPI0040552C63
MKLIFRKSDGRVLLAVPEEVGSPEGITVDASGDLWVAIYGGGRAGPGAGVVHRFETDATGAPAAPFRPDPGWWAAPSR